MNNKTIDFESVREKFATHFIICSLHESFILKKKQSQTLAQHDITLRNLDVSFDRDRIESENIR